MSVEDELQFLKERQELIDEEILSLKELLEELKKTTKELKDLLEIYKNFQFALKLFSWIERTAIFIAKIGAAVTVMWASWRFVISETFEHLSKK